MTKLQKWLALIGTVLGLLVTVFALWPVIGWTTPNQHDNDFVVAVNAMREFRDEWKCDEYDEELLDLEHELAITEIEEIKVAIQHHIDKIKKKMEETKCSRFEDFG